ncbi:haloacid dehalogenase-like hydrolase [Patescibacteria group bacterium]|nr:haloacid dehalogenase-like hydrolase [Patescibacteria group bacterium]MBU4453283.1 haloacid dehalogenase-like hydrolase [Patescibacteria group bacterium]MCG2687322.1 haloacid dehalogenase-like hydrolase [Candidatus Parcubacteria bacterium]
MSIQTSDTGSYDGLMERIGSSDAGTDMLIANNGIMSWRDLVVKVRQAQALGIDFDKTITRGDGMFDAIRRELMTPDCARRDEECARAYFGGAHQSHFGCCDFLFGSIDRMIESRVDERRFESALCAIAPRDGAIEFMRTFNSSGAFTCAVITFGLADWVERWFAFRHFMPLSSPTEQEYNPIARQRIYGLRLHWDADGQLRGYDPTTAITDFNKGLAFQAHCASCGVELCNALALGDSPITDIGMLREATQSGGAGILLIPKTECAKLHANSRTGEALRSAFPSIAGFLVSDSLMPLADIRTGRVQF